LTLVGPGGIGKTRLALEAAQRISMFTGVQVVYLQALTSPEFIIPTIAETLGLHFYSGSEPHQQLLDYLGKASMLLVLDNFEHLLDGTELLTDILEAAPDVWLLVTSRERLNLREEWVLDVGGLPYPSGETDTPIKEFDAIQLFMQHARKAKADFALTDNLKPTITRICRLLGGMPLGIELAASWVRALPCEAIATEIERSLDILETSARNTLPRHRNMRAAFQPTWERLTEEERRIFIQLSVFRGGFTHDAAERVAGASLRTLTALVDKSLIRVDANGRYDLHELLRQYGEEKLNTSGDMQPVSLIHSTYYAEFINSRINDLKGLRQIEALIEIAADFENVRVAWNWAVEHQGAQNIEKMVEGLRLFCDIRNRQEDGFRLFRLAEQAFSHASHFERLWGRLLARVNDSPQKLQNELEQALQIAKHYDDRAEIALCLYRLAEIAEDRVQSEDLLKQSLNYYRELGDRYEEADVLFKLMSNLMHSNYVGVWNDFKKYGYESLRLRREIGDQVGIAWSIAPIAHGATAEGRFAESEQLWQERIALGQKVGATGLVALGYAHISYSVYFNQGNFIKADACAREAIRIGTKINFSNPIGFGLTTLGLIASIEEDYPKAKTLCQQAAASTSFTWIIGLAAWGSALAACGLGDYQAVSEFLPDAIKHLIYIFGYVGTVDCLPIAAILLAQEGEPIRAVELLALAYSHPALTGGWIEKWSLLTRICTQLEETLGNRVYAAAWERGMRLDLDEVATELMHQTPIKPVYSVLSERELEVLRLVANGCSNQEIADRLYIGVSTVKKHINHIYDKLDAKNRTQAVAVARQQHLLGG
jgi:predicted ATPase/DNA-binding CsgD family transcriptional regulator